MFWPVKPAEGNAAPSSDIASIAPVLPGLVGEGLVFAVAFFFASAFAPGFAVALGVAFGSALVGEGVGSPPATAAVGDAARF